MSISLADVRPVPVLSFSLVKGGVGNVDEATFFVAIAGEDAKVDAAAEELLTADDIFLLVLSSSIVVDELPPVRPFMARFCMGCIASSSSIAPSEDRSIVCLDADEAEGRRVAALLLGRESSRVVFPLRLSPALPLLEPAWLVEGVIGVLGAAGAEGRGLKNPSRLDCFVTGLLMIRAHSLLVSLRGDYTGFMSMSVGKREKRRVE
jgi:hypothetical protein